MPLQEESCTTYTVGLSKPVKEKVQEWVGEIARLSSIASTQPHAAYAALSHDLFSKWTYLMRTQPDISDFLEPLQAIH